MDTKTRACGLHQRNACAGIPEARLLLRQTGRLCLNIAESGDEREVNAALRTLQEMPAILRGRGLVLAGERQPWQ